MNVKQLKRLLFILWISQTSNWVKAQKQYIPIDEKYNIPQSMQVNNRFNEIYNYQLLEQAYEKLYKIKNGTKNQFSIVHIGDSHLQAGFISDYIRISLQDFFGNSGRGLVFPYELAKSNPPADISSQSDFNWSFNRVAHPEINLLSGISGFIVQSNSPNASFKLMMQSNINSKNNAFNRVKVFTDLSDSVNWKMFAGTETFSVGFDKSKSFHQYTFEKAALSLQFTGDSSARTKTFFGVSLENDSPGVIYHTIGVNGAKYEQYNMAENFWNQLSALNADLYIISLGTNEAQTPAIDLNKFKLNLILFLNKLKKVSPDAIVIITTAGDSFIKYKPNISIKQINDFLAVYCTSNRIPIWDLYRVTNGYKSSYKWKKSGLMSKDLVHYTSAGYHLQAQLFFNAFAKGYNQYIDKF